MIKKIKKKYTIYFKKITQMCTHVWNYQQKNPKNIYTRTIFVLVSKLKIEGKKFLISHWCTRLKERHFCSHLESWNRLGTRLLSALCRPCFSIICNKNFAGKMCHIYYTRIFDFVQITFVLFQEIVQINLSCTSL